MPFQVSRTDTGQFVLIDPATDTVVIDDDLGHGFARLEQVVADKPRLAPPRSGGPDSAIQGSVFGFRGGPRYTPILLAVVLPFAWLAVLYFALAQLLAETALDRDGRRATEDRLEQLERELQTLRAERAAKPRQPKPRPASAPQPQ